MVRIGVHSAGHRSHNETFAPDFEAQDLQNLTDGLIHEGFQPYLTSVGGSGLGILSPSDCHCNRRTVAARRAFEVPGQITPPETPNPGDEASYLLNVNSAAGVLEPLRPSFEMSSISELPSWAESLGRWLYV